METNLKTENGKYGMNMVTWSFQPFAVCRKRDSKSLFCYESLSNFLFNRFKKVRTTYMFSLIRGSRFINSMTVDEGLKSLERFIFPDFTISS